MLLSGPTYIISKVATISAIKKFFIVKLNFDEIKANDLVSSIFVLYGFVGKLIGPSYGGCSNDYFGFNFSCIFLIILCLISIVCINYFTNNELFLIKSEYSLEEKLSPENSEDIIDYLSDACTAQEYSISNRVSFRSTNEKFKARSFYEVECKEDLYSLNDFYNTKSFLSLKDYDLISQSEFSDNNGTDVNKIKFKNNYSDFDRI